MIYRDGASLPGFGDEATWPPCTGHPNDPRSPEITLDDEIAELRSQRKDELIDEEMSGRGPFWSTDMRDPDTWDVEQDRSLFLVMGAMLRLPNTTEEQRWRGLMAAVNLLAREYAQSRVER